MNHPEKTDTIRDRLARLRSELEPVGTLVETVVPLPRSGARYRIMHPADIDPLIDAVADDPEQNLPYWAELWPSGIALADAIALRPQTVAGFRVLEIGCGLGVTAIAALNAGADLTVTDYAPESLLLACANCLANSGREPSTLQMNWRKPPDELFDLAGEGFPVVLAADVLYESRDVQPLLGLLGRLVAPGGLLWLAEPRRPVAARFIEIACAQDWELSESDGEWDGPWPDPNDAGVHVRVHRLRRVPSPGS